MNTYKAPLKDMKFVLFDLLKAERTYRELDLAAADRELSDAVLEEAAKFAETVLAPINADGDREGCRFDRDTGAVATPPGFREAYAQFVEGGWSGLTAPEAFGGQGLPESLACVFKEMIDAANLSWGNYPLLSHGATEALKHHGEDWQREAFLKPIVAGRWTGTMCLTEPHCGSDLGLLKTRAVPEADGSYAVTGTKIFITGGEHDLTDNIVHLVLARLPDAPAGVKGISLFIVPKLKTARDGSTGGPNAVRCGSIEHKMGIHGSATCVMNFDGAQGYLIGQPNRGLNAMFTMMNSARVAVGLQGLGLMDRATQNALAYARERLQMRAAAGAKFPDKPADPIIVHPDVRRMLLTCKALTEGARCLAYQATVEIDKAERAASPEARAEAELFLGFLTPIVKGALTEWANECAYHALQCFGGHGYVREWGMEQLARDARITTIYEGTTGIQALDLLGRKTLHTQGAGLKRFLGLIEALVAAEPDGEFSARLKDTAALWAAVTREIGGAAAADPDAVGAASVDYLFLSAYACLAYWWAESARVAQASGDAALAKAKLETARFYFDRILPRAAQHAAAIRGGSASLMALDAELF
ncbi:acyl-CoA dehydrogenase [Arenimonas maotaiensis]|uniref:3-methylmercaptopropionyl-CoA dehydrogenase n=1 Tax=Arenimonas maotaiensis TaxID=1446479 RepID=A0A917CDS0_9GAMM|nr:acyl-CoA dehydrogenase C-terminal domain-containing protein [Arenimonas maotaiensis]GGF85432.1 acyl-CoA dehydrogenase [Arenimonas maotaiensis]